MQKENFITGLLVLVFCLLITTVAIAHTPLCSCYDNGDGTITCEGGFSDGSSAEGVEMKIMDKAGKIIIKGRMNEDSEFIFDKPTGPYKVLLDAGPGHRVEMNGVDIVE